ncbi:MAG: Ig-like domain-containing protein, partial [Verrucomicrobia bacterium]|nr:Ig-like domain-containing protein [Verrucomicrobiota bacterium]
MKRQIQNLFASLWMAALFGPMTAPVVTEAATIWNGPHITKSNADGPDLITPNVALTRGSSQGLYNSQQEAGFTHGLSPIDTEWANGTLANYATLSYTDWNSWAKGVNPSPPSTVGVDAVLHLKTDDIYISIKFVSWVAASGAYSYERSTPTPANLPPSVTITNPLSGASFFAPATVTIQAAASDPDGTVANVAFFDGVTSLGSVTTSPYNLTVSLVVGSHTLTAVATDNLGLSTTSAGVSVTVNVGNSPPSVTITNPPDNATFGNTDTVTVQASTSDSDGTVTNVQLFNGAVLLRSFATGPYTFTGKSISGNFALGTNTLTAVATDNLGAATTSAPVHVIIARYLPPITNGTIAIVLQPVATGLAAPDYAISPPGDTHRLFVLEQNGLVRIIQDGALLPGAALNITNRVQPPLNPANPNDERGLLGLAFHPGFNNPASPGYQTLYTYNSEMIPTNTTPTYPVPTTATNNYKNVINEWKISTTNANVVDPASRREVISFGKNAANHNGGTIAFGPDGYMYIALGDGGDANDVGASHIEPGGNAQNLSTPLGKMLRLDPLNPALTTGSPNPISANGQYRIPTSNPFQGAGQVPEIYAYGLRNPYRFSFDRANGELIQADVG